MRRHVLIAGLAAMLALIAAVPAAAAVPQGFVGVDLDGPLFGVDDSIDLNQQMGTMVANGVQSVRVAFNWAVAEPYASWRKIPRRDRDEYFDVNGKPFLFAQTDAIVADAAAHGLTVLPTVLYTPRWDALHNRRGPVNTPRRSAPYGGYLTALIARYGPRGSFWTANPQLPRVPIRAWQIWNEENLSYYWPQPYARSYAGLLRSAHAAVHRADPGAKVVLGALTDFAWDSIAQIYRLRGGRKLFDVAAVNSFTKRPADVIQYLQFMRNAMTVFGDRNKPLLATEVSWPSALGKTREHFDFDTTEAGQARNIAALLAMIGRTYRHLHLAGFDYYTWMGDEGDHSLAFNYAGLLRFHDNRITAKPALAAFRRGVLTLEQCTSKGPLATSCVR